jgi:hypothetical protein
LINIAGKRPHQPENPILLAAKARLQARNGGQHHPGLPANLANCVRFPVLEVDMGQNVCYIVIDNENANNFGPVNKGPHE